VRAVWDVKKESLPGKATKAGAGGGLSFVESMLESVLGLRKAANGSTSGPTSGSGALISEWGHAFIAADVVIDSKLNAVIVDLNSMPSFYHFNTSAHAPGSRPPAWPAWFVRERSATIRTAFDILEDIAGCKLRDQETRAGSAGVDGAGRRRPARPWPEEQGACWNDGIMRAQGTGWQLLHDGKRSTKVGDWGSKMHRRGEWEGVLEPGECATRN
jgi:hypothetical protein